MDAHARMEKEQVLWEGKFKFLEQQKKDAKKSLAENQKRFENSL